MQHEHGLLQVQYEHSCKTRYREQVLNENKVRMRFKYSPYERAPRAKDKLHGTLPCVQARRRLSNADTLIPLHLSRVAQAIYER